MNIALVVLAIVLIVFGAVVLVRFFKKLHSNETVVIDNKQKTTLLLAIGAIITGLVILFKQSKK